MWLYLYRTLSDWQVTIRLLADGLIARIQFVREFCYRKHLATTESNHDHTR